MRDFSRVWSRAQTVFTVLSMVLGWLLNYCVPHPGISELWECIYVFVYKRFFSPLANLLFSSIRLHIIKLFHFLCVSLRDGVICCSVTVVWKYPWSCSRVHLLFYKNTTWNKKYFRDNWIVTVCDGCVRFCVLKGILVISAKTARVRYGAYRYIRIVCGETRKRVKYLHGQKKPEDIFTVVAGKLSIARYLWIVYAIILLDYNSEYVVQKRFLRVCEVHKTYLVK